MSQFTSQWYQSQLARRTPQPTAETGVDHESELHDDIVAECRRRKWGFIHSRMDLPSTTGVGTPDFCILRDGGRVLLVECKTRTGKLSPAQLAFKCQAECNGHAVHVVRSLQEFLSLLETDKAHQQLSSHGKYSQKD